SSMLMLAPPPSLHALSLHDALPISRAIGLHLRSRCQLLEIDLRRDRRIARGVHRQGVFVRAIVRVIGGMVDDLQVHVEPGRTDQDRKSTRLNSSHVKISYAVFCLKK